ncbi:hypothetical protein BJF83_18440 [Nocardiopsis sp. CNR-923]|uniref:hypothetical protein n=1 Tax=Nocardiopsis sp. CNR-923 TaxID=1904965 RepID=UPI00095AAFC1|nr:hypothetical protein [Nocardiopsis sp. CNR-923]OLT27556.1 hypothetical protein BJF83_18440 [Nocardiopsis sp. CNR-923]
MPAPTRAQKQPFVGRQTWTRASILADQVGLSTARILEFLLNAYASGQITTDHLADTSPNADREQIGMRLSADTWRRADDQRRTDGVRSMSALVDKLLVAYAEGRVQVGVTVRPLTTTPHRRGTHDRHRPLPPATRH